MLEAKHKTTYMSKLEERIQTTCSGHIRWLRLIREPKGDPSTNTAELPPWNDEEITNEYIIQAGCFAADYWVTGVIMTRSIGSLTWLPRNRVTDTALHVAKLAEYKKLVLGSKDEDLKQEMENVLNDVYVPWLIELDRMDIRKTCSWPHSNVDGIIKCSLDDHFWIWTALKCLDDEAEKIRLPLRQHRDDFKDIAAGHRKWLQHLCPVSDGVSPSSESLEARIRGFMGITKRLSPNNLQRNMLQRFTAENDVLKPARRMLAVARSAVDMRFLLHARDAALFFDEDAFFFIPGTSFMQLWQNTIDAQLCHEENVYADSDNALRYALGIVMGVRGHTLSRTNNAFDMVKESTNILLGAGGSDAFFPRQLDEGAREPTSFSQEEYRDHSYHTGFEINYVLLSSAKTIQELLLEKAPELKKSHGQDHPPSCTDRSSHQQQDQPETFKTTAKTLQTISGTNKTVRFLDDQPKVTMKKFLPFTNVIPATNVNHMGDEWLYQYPDFLRDRLDIESFELQEILDASGKPPETFVSLCYKILDKTDVGGESQDSESEESHSQMTVHVVDIRKGKKRLDKRHTVGINAEELPQKSVIHRISEISTLCDFLAKPRTAWTAKKRIVRLPRAGHSVAMARCVLSPERERSVLRRFF